MIYTCYVPVLLGIIVPKYKNITLYILSYTCEMCLTIKTLDRTCTFREKNSEIVFELVCHKPNGSRLPNLGI